MCVRSFRICVHIWEQFGSLSIYVRSFCICVRSFRIFVRIWFTLGLRQASSDSVKLDKSVSDYSVLGQAFLQNLFSVLGRAFYKNN